MRIDILEGVSEEHIYKSPKNIERTRMRKLPNGSYSLTKKEEKMT